MCMRLNIRFLIPVFLVLATLISSCSHVSYEAYNQDRKERRSVSAKKQATKRYASSRARTTRPASARARVERPTEIDNVAIRSAIVSDAMRHVGTRYVYGGKRPGGFDCSGFTAYVLSGQGVAVSGSSRDQALMGRRKDRADLAPGDLAFFGSRGKVTHVGIVKQNTGDKLYVVHATSSAGVRTDDVLGSDYWKDRFLFGSDVIR